MVPILFDLISSSSSSSRNCSWPPQMLPEEFWPQLQLSQLPQDVCCGHRVVAMTSGGVQGTGLDHMEDGVLLVPHPQVMHRWAAAVHWLNRRAELLPRARHYCFCKRPRSDRNRQIKLPSWIFTDNEHVRDMQYFGR